MGRVHLIQSQHGGMKWGCFPTKGTHDVMMMRLQAPTMQATAKSAPRSPTSGVGIVWRVGRAQDIPNDILVRTALALRFQPAVLSFFAPMTHVQRYCLAGAGGAEQRAPSCLLYT